MFNQRKKKVSGQQSRGSLASIKDVMQNIHQLEKSVIESNRRIMQWNKSNRQGNA